MIESIEVKVISRLLTTDDEGERMTLLGFDSSYYSAYKPEIEYILNHYDKYQILPSLFDFNAQFIEFNFVQVPEPLNYLVTMLKKYKKRLILLETFNKIKDLGDGDVEGAWEYLGKQYDRASTLDESKPLDIIKDAKLRADQVIEYSKQKRIPTGFQEIDKLMYGGLSTIEELLVLIARTNSGKSWCCARMAESAQRNGFKVAYYSPEMQGAYLATRFDTWRGHYKNSDLFRGVYSEEYWKYIRSLPQDDTSVFIIEDKDFPQGVSVRSLDPFIKKEGIKLLIIDGISYMKDDDNAVAVHERYKNIAKGLFTLSKKHGCAVVLVMQASRDVKSKDDKGESIPDLFCAEGSDQPGRIATQAFGIRQIFDKHVLDIKLLKTRMANNDNPVLSYAWDVNTGNATYLPEGHDDISPSSPSTSATVTPDILSNVLVSNNQQMMLNSDSGNDLDEDDDVEF